MYESYWQLTTRPFENISDEEFYYPGEGHQGALLKLRYSIETGKEAGLLVGDHGSGKTMIIDLLGQQLPEQFQPVVHVVFPQMPPAELLAYIADQLAPGSLSTELPSVQRSVKTIQETLTARTAEGLHTVLVIDEAQLIDDPACWEALRLLLNFQSQGRPDLTMLLVGQLPLLTTLQRMPAWEERLSVKCLLKPLSLEETACYLQHRLQLAGGRAEIFQAESIEAIHRLSGGLPRRINRLADLALVIGYAEERPTITPAEIDAVAGELITVTDHA